MSIDPKSRVENYARKKLADNGRFTKEEVDKIISHLSQMSWVNSEKAVNAFLKAAGL